MPKLNVTSTVIPRPRAVSSSPRSRPSAPASRVPSGRTTAAASVGSVQVAQTRTLLKPSAARPPRSDATTSAVAAHPP
jgi:hypothetical protein